MHAVIKGASATPYSVCIPSEFTFKSGGSRALLVEIGIIPECHGGLHVKLEAPINDLSLKLLDALHCNGLLLGAPTTLRILPTWM